jgi:hypothetical protein
MRGYSELIVTSTGDAESISATIQSALIQYKPEPKPEWKLSWFPAWEATFPEEGQDARFRDELSLLAEVESSAGPYPTFLASTVTVKYRDLFGDWHTKSFQFEGMRNSSVSHPSEVDPQQGERCNFLVERTLNEALSRFGRASFGTRSVWKNFHRYAHVVSKSQALDCLGPPWSPLREEYN